LQQAYVALSRVRSSRGLLLLEEMPLSFITARPPAALGAEMIRIKQLSDLTHTALVEGLHVSGQSLDEFGVDMNEGQVEVRRPLGAPLAPSTLSTGDEARLRQAAVLDRVEVLFHVDGESRWYCGEVSRMSSSLAAGFYDVEFDNGDFEDDVDLTTTNTDWRFCSHRLGHCGHIWCQPDS
jgi:hypothetical protein